MWVNTTKGATRPWSNGPDHPIWSDIAHLVHCAGSALPVLLADSADPFLGTIFSGMGDIEQELMDLEESLWRPLTRFDSAHMYAVLAQGFTEFGQSGEVYTRSEIISAPARDFSTRLPLPDFAVRLLGDDVALVTYRSEVRYGNEAVCANRSSLWRRGKTGWLLEFHQGTPTAE